MNILLLSAPYDTGRYRVGENLGIKYISAMLQSKGYDVDIFDLSLDQIGIDGICGQTYRRRYDLVGVGIPFTTAVSKAMDVVKEIRERCDVGHLTIGGQGISFIWQDILKNESGVDSCVVFEGEYTVLEIVRNLESDNSLKKIRGIYLRDDNQVIFTGYREPTVNLDALGFPTRKQHSTVMSQPHFLLLTSRGCSMNCTFCISGNYGNRYHAQSKWRYRTPENVVSEMCELREKYGANVFSFIDDAFLGGNLSAGKDRARYLARILRSDFPDARWSIECRADEVDRDLFFELYAGGLRHVFVGIDSGNEKDLQLYGKQISLRQIEEAIQVVNGLRLSSEFGFIMFHPMTTFENIEQNLDFLKNHGIASAAILTNKLELYPGSGLLRKFTRDGFVKRKNYLFTYTFADESISLLYKIVSTCLPLFKSIEIKLAMSIFKLQTSLNDIGYPTIQSLFRLQNQICRKELGVFEYVVNSLKAKAPSNGLLKNVDNLLDECAGIARKQVADYSLKLKEILIDKPI